MFCNMCGSATQTTDNFCGHCGSSLLLTKRPCLQPNASYEDIVKFYFESGYKYGLIVGCLQQYHGVTISLRTLKRDIKQFGLRRHHEVTADVIDKADKAISSELQGPGQLMGYRLMHRTLLLKYGISIPRNHTMQLLKFKDPTGVLERKRRVLRRRTYTALGPSYLWHADGHDKLKRYGFPIHACIDGYSRRIIWINCSTTNNDPKVIGYYYLTAIKQLGGCPHILRTDCGTENVLIATLQCTIRNTNRAHLYGTSQNNQRIESWWSYMSNMRTRWWIEFFDTMEQAGFLNTDNTDEIDCLRFSFMSILRCQLLEVQTLWNNHYIRQSRGARCPGGVPEHLFFTPRNALQCLVPLNGNVNDFFHLCTVPQICQNTELQASLKQYCDTMAISTPTNIDEGVQVFRLLKSLFV